MRAKWIWTSLLAIVTFVLWLEHQMRVFGLSLSTGHGYSVVAHVPASSPPRKIKGSPEGKSGELVLEPRCH